MVAGATPDKSGQQLILSLRRMNNIGTVDPNDGLVTCDAGVILQNLHEAAAQFGRRFPLTLGGKGSATVGGLISTNAGGLPELCIQGITGFMSNVGDIDDMSRNALLILDKSNLPTFKKNALKRAKEFDISNILPLYEGYYQKILEKTAARMLL